MDIPKRAGLEIYAKLYIQGPRVTFVSLESFDQPHRSGTPIPVRVHAVAVGTSAAGRTSIAAALQCRAPRSPNPS